MAKLCLIDGSGFIFRAFHALPPLSTKEGLPVNAVYGFTRAMMALQEKKDIDYIAVVFDSSRVTFRQEIYQEYKAQRVETPEDLIPQFGLFREAVEALNIPFIEKEGFEADDLIATYTSLAKQANIEVEILSSDKDLMQLIDDSKNVYMFDPLKKKYIKENEVLEKFGVSPSLVVQVQALMGDSSDNVPGVRGVGSKTASKLINEFGSVENIYNNIESIDNENLKSKLINSKELAFISLKLVTLKQDIFLDCSFEKLEFKKPQPEILYKFLNKLSFSSMALKIAKEHNLDVKALDKDRTIEGDLLIHNTVDNDSNVQSAKKSVALLDNILIDTKELYASAIKSVVEELLQNQNISIFINDFKLEDKLILSIFNEITGINYEILVKKEDKIENLFSQDDSIGLVDVLKDLKQVLESSHIKKIFYNVKPVLKICQNNKIEIKSYEDVMLMCYLLKGAITSKTSIISFLEQEYITVDEGDVKGYHLYCLYSIYWDEIISARVKYVYEVCDKPLIGLLAEMEQTGVLIHKESLLELSKYYAVMLQKLEKEIYNLAGEEFNLASPKQIGEILFNKMQIKGKKNKTGSWKTSASFLEDLAEEGLEIAALILQWRQIFKLKGTYSDSLVQKIDPATNRVHTTFLQCQTTTARLSSIEPNLQNIPIKSIEGKNIRKAFIASVGYKLVSLDYSQIELRILAIIANVKSLLGAFKKQEDIHKKTAMEIFNVDLDAVNEDLRRKAKAINFGIIYGQSEHGLASSLGIRKDEARSYIDSYFAKYPEIKTYMDNTLEIARKNGYVLTIFGRKCFVKDINNKNYNLRSLAERAAINARIQGSSADIMRLAMITANNVITKNHYDAKIILQIHDEILVEVKTELASEVAKHIQQAMMAVVSLLIPLEVNFAIGDNWIDAH